jgi:hypothetical protein
LTKIHLISLSDRNPVPQWVNWDTSIPIKERYKKIKIKLLKKFVPKQKSITDYSVPALTAAQIKKFNKILSLFFYDTSTSFQRIEHPFLLEALQILRPDIKLIDRKALAGRQLNEAYDFVHGAVKQKVENEHYYSTLTTDAWTNCKSQSIVNYCSCQAGETIFLKSDETGSQSHDANWISNEIVKVIDENPFLVGVCTDNTSANTSAWDRLKEMKPLLFAYGCAAHITHLLVKDLFYSKESVTHPFQDLIDLLEQCIEISKYFKRHSMEFSRFKEIEGKIKSFKLPGETRWGSIGACVEVCIDLRTELLSFTTNLDWLSKGNAQQKARKIYLKTACESLNNNYLKLLLMKKMLEITDSLLVMFQNDRVPLSTVYHTWINLHTKFSTIGLTDHSFQFVTRRITTRWNQLNSDAHGVAYLLDPKFTGLNMPELEEERLITLIANFDSVSPRDEEKLQEAGLQYYQFREYSSRIRETQSTMYSLVQSGKESIKGFWKNLVTSKKFPLISNLALRVFSLVASSASSERNFSLMGFIHNKTRNRLNPETVRKLSYVKTNLRAINPIFLDYYGDDLSDPDDTDKEDDDLEPAIELNDLEPAMQLNDYAEV